MVGASDLQRSSDYYDAVLAPLGLVRVESNDSYVGYAPNTSPSEIEFYVTIPFDQKPATFGNGTMIAFAAESRRAVDLLSQYGAGERRHGRRRAGTTPRRRNNLLCLCPGSGRQQDLRLLPGRQVAPTQGRTRHGRNASSTAAWTVRLETAPAGPGLSRPLPPGAMRRAGAPACRRDPRSESDPGRAASP